MKTYLIPEELLKRVIAAIVDYQEDSKELDNLRGFLSYTDDLVFLETKLKELKELNDESIQ